MSDPYIKNGLLINKLGIEDSAQLSFAEHNLAAIREVELAHLSIKHSFDLKYIKFIHHYLFQDIYEWAGEVRTVEIAKGDAMFALCMHIERSVEYLATQIKKDKITSNPEHLADRAGFYLGELNAIHPFREGNGRTQRIFITNLVKQFNFNIDWTDVTQKNMIDASIVAYADNHADLSAIIYNNLYPCH